MCMAVFFPVALIISATYFFPLCPSFNLKAFERHQLYKIWPYMGTLIICLCLYIPIYCSSNLSCSKEYWKINLSMYTSSEPPYWSMKSTNSSQCLASVYEAWSGLGARTISLPFDTQWIITVNVVSGNTGRLLLAILPARSLNCIAGYLLPCLPLIHASQISLARVFRNISTYCGRIHTPLLKLTDYSKIMNIAKNPAIDISQCMGPSRTCFNQFCPRIMDRCFFFKNLTSHTFFHLSNALKLGCLILLANCFKEISVCFSVIGGVPAAPPKSDKLSLSSAASYSL